MEGQRKLLAAVVFGLLSLAALVVIILLKQFTPEVFTAWMTGTAGVFGLYMGANVVSKFAPVAPPKEPDIVVMPSSSPDPKERGGAGLFGLSGRRKKG